MSRGAARIALAASTLCVLTIVLYFIGFQFWTGEPHADLGRSLLTMAQFVTQSTGWCALLYWPGTGIFVVTLLALSLVRLASAIGCEPAERMRTLGLAACFAAALTLAAAVGWGRGLDSDTAGFANRYGLFAAPIVTIAYLVWCRYGRGELGRLVQGVFAVGFSLCLLQNFDNGADSGKERVQTAAGFERDLKAGASPEELAFLWGDAFFCGPDSFLPELRHLRAARFAPFDQLAEEQGVDDAPRPRWTMMKSAPGSWHAEKPLMSGKSDGIDVLFARPPSELYYRLAPGARHLHARFGILPTAWKDAGCQGVRFSVESSVRGAVRQIVFERTLDPGRNAEDRGPQTLELDVRVSQAGTLRLGTTRPSSAGSGADWAYWTEIELR